MDPVWNLIQPLLPGLSPTVVLVILGFIVNGKLKDLKADVMIVKACIPNCAVEQSKCANIRRDKEEKLAGEIENIKGRLNGSRFKPVENEV